MAFCMCQPEKLEAAMYRTLPSRTDWSNVLSVSSIGVSASKPCI